MTDIQRIIVGLDRHKISYFTREADGGNTELVCYEPYVTHNESTNDLEILCYVYHWIDTYDINGKFLNHRVYEGTYTKELDTSL